MACRIKDYFILDDALSLSFSLSLSLSLPHLSPLPLSLQQITGIPPDGLTPEEIERMRKKFGVSFKFSKFVLDKGVQVSHTRYR